MRAPPPYVQEALYHALDYDPVTGDLRWREDRRRVREGDLAGSVSRDGAIVVGFMKNVYQASHIAWFLTKGDWPEFQIHFNNSDPMDLRFSNLVLMQFDTAYKSPQSFTKALKAREYRARKKAAKKLVRPTSTRDNVTCGVDGVWSVRSLHEARHVFISFEHRKDAEDYADLYARGLRYCHLNRAATYPADAASLLAGGPGALTLQQASDRFAYNPDTGAIYRRNNIRLYTRHSDGAPLNMEGTPAVELGPTRRPIVRASGRTYSAGMLAWFLYNCEWPKRKQLGYRDKNPANTKLDNLYLKKDRPDATRL